ncbi:cytochrome P450 [Temperatibacter marinus]|uniref:Cytochrome P450 n=1 Tax=Temperatibacter marinus TaxID=1456591 RepID=A0AA52EGA0_9PROT|nr:cytochrome P450 [Temperatibacter marinus]WND01992.1 cytochrome P450 [Temperatibacter marinus]
MAEDNISQKAACPFHPPKPKHRKHGLSFIRRLFLGRKMDMLGNYTEKAYSYLMGKNNMGLGSVYAINCLESTRKVLVDESDDFPKSEVMYRTLEPLVGRSVFSVNGEEWKAQRKRLAPAFAHLHVQRGFGGMMAAVDRMLKEVKVAAEGDGLIDIDKVMSKVTADVIFRVMFSGSLDGPRGNAIYTNFQRYQQEQRYFSLRTLINWPRWMPILGHRQNKKAREAASSIREILFDIVTQRIALPVADRPEDMLTAILVEYSKDFKDDIPVVELVDQIAFFFLAGHETTAASTTWASYLLSQSPEDENRLVREVYDVTQKEPIEFKDLKKLRFVDAVFKESMRLYAPVPYFPRESTKPTQIRTHNLKKGSQITVNAYFIHRNTRWWDQPDHFIPSRFLEEGGCPENKLAFIPFSAGPRICPGANFATVEATLILASLFKEYSLTLEEDFAVEPFAQLTLKPKKGILMRVSKRDEPSSLE